MKHLFLPYAIALALKEKGFKEDCIAHYSFSGGEPTITTNPRDFNYLPDDGQPISAPLYQQAVDWFEKKHGLFLCVEHGGKVNGTYKHDVVIWGRTSVSMRGFTSTETAWEKAILKALTLIK